MWMRQINMCQLNVVFRKAPTTCINNVDTGKIVIASFTLAPSHHQYHSCISPRRYIYSVYNVQNWNRCLQYNRLLCHGLTVTNRPTHPCMNITRCIPQHPLERERVSEKIKIFIINFCFSLYFAILKSSRAW